MDRNSVDWKGYWPASPTPFKENGEIDFTLLGLLIDSYLNLGMHGIFINGTTGEWFSQTHEERKEVAAFVLDRVAGRIPVVVGVTTFTAKESIKLGEHAISVGAAGICSSAPAYSKTLPDETFAYFEDLGKGVPAPTMIYNWPYGTSIEIEGDLARRLADLENVVAIKDSTGNVDQFFATAKALIKDVRIFGNFMTPSNLDFMTEFGGDGTIGGGSIFGAADPQYWENYWAGNLEPVRAHANRNLKLLEALWEPGGWRGKWGGYQSQLKAIMAIMGAPGGTVRRPRLAITDSQSLEKIRSILIEFDIPVVK
ncbi:MAG: dihydrodipicolinate synthase family protein [Actinobacteria bacterium]|nr:dihydrodipicolinate synthase family protein [Actinomycetota bacterium]